MKEAFSGCAIVIGALVLMLVVGLGVTWVAQGNDFFLYKVFGPKYEQQRREIFEKSRSYNEGMRQELANMQFDYIREKDPRAKQALASIILHRVSEYDETELSPDLRAFVRELRQQQRENP